MKKIYWLLSLFCLIVSIHLSAQKTITARPEPVNDVLLNPGIGFMTFQRFNGDTLNPGYKWTEGFPIVYQDFDGDLSNKDYPMTSLAYFRIYWRYLEPQRGKYNWSMIDKALKTSMERNQTLLVRIAPYGSGTDTATDIPAWFRAMVGSRNEWLPSGSGWRVDAEDPRYAMYFSKLVTEFGKRYDGHPALESVDLSIVGFWGEGRGGNLLSDVIRKTLVGSYTENFKKTPLIIVLESGEKANKYGLSQRDIGWRVDCIGDLGMLSGTKENGGLMQNRYARDIINFGMKDAWKKAPVSLEVCGTVNSWKAAQSDCKNCQGTTDEELEYIMKETLKWHISSFNAKSNAVPAEWMPRINEWINKMGYRFELRTFSYPETVSPNGKLSFRSWWDNKGVAPCYKKYLLAIKLSNNLGSRVLITDAEITGWLPGDIIYDDSVFIPSDMQAGEYDLKIGIVDSQSHQPKIKLAIKGIDSEGWYGMGRIKVAAR